jgi:hypothetical protein|tara:strand:+ start:700 stop:1395 length:696 start_codon:yes stop_codon:yes gene_type:complete
MLQIIVHVWGDLYGEKYIDRLKKDIEKHTTVPWNLTVLRDQDNEWKKYSEKYYRGEGEPRVCQGERWTCGHHTYDLAGLPLYKKILPWFDQKIGKKNDIFMYLDIDVKINGDLKYFIDLEYDKPWVQYDYNIDQWSLINDYKNQNITPINTSILTWKKGQLKPITDLITKNPDEVFFTYRRVDAYVWYRFGVKDFFNYFPEDKVDWYYKNSNAIIRNLAGEDIKLKDTVIV